jgi:tRNA G18 (ribose-2'-O)-methylase SpoU
VDFEAYWGLSDRDWTRSGLTLAEGTLLARRLLQSRLQPEAVLCLPAHEAEFSELAAGRCELKVLSPQEMDQWAGFAFHRGVVAIARRPPPLTLEAFLAGEPAPRRLAVAPNLTDPENLGSVFRTALALGWDAVAVGPSSCDPYSRRCAKVSMGAVYAHPPVELGADAAVTKRLFGQAHWTCVALTLEPGAVELERWREGEGRSLLQGPLAAWVGNEAQGLSAGDRSVCQTALVVPMAAGHDSLNAAVAAGIGFYRLTASADSSGTRGL